MGSIRRYLLYSIGEIFLVVVGILIALQVNNWNQKRQERTLEIEILEEIRENLLTDLDDHNRNLHYLNHVVQSSGIVLNHLNTDLPYHDSLATHFSWLPMAANVNPVNSGYNLLLSKGVNLISNDEVRKSISFLYENNYVWLKEFLKDRQYINNPLLLSDMMKRFKTFEIMKEAVPRDYDKLKNDDDFKVQTQQYAYIIKLTYDSYRDKLVLVEELILNLEEEVQRLKEN